nr:ATP-binding protein [Antarcticibacterium sp. 1MA-6-2]
MIIEKREEVHGAFEARKNALVEKRNKKAMALQNAAERILKGAHSKAERFTSASEIHGYFAADLMINKVRDIIKQLVELDDSGKAEEIETSLKTARENALRRLKDKLELYEDGDNVIRLGKHKFGVNKQPLDLTIVLKDGAPHYHLTGTDFYQELKDETLLNSQKLWEQEFVSENERVYRSSYLAYKLFRELPGEELLKASEEELLKIVQKESSSDYSEGYIKGVHDVDAAKILSVLVHKHHELGLLIFSPQLRSYAQYFWNSLPVEARKELDQTLKASGEVLTIFPATKEYDFLIQNLQKQIEIFAEETGLFSSAVNEKIAIYLFEELQNDDEFVRSSVAISLKEDFLKALKNQQADLKFKNSYEAVNDYKGKIRLIKQWVSAFVNSKQEGSEKDLLLNYIDEVVCIILFGDESISKTKAVFPAAAIEGLTGEHPSFKEGVFNFNYHKFISQLEEFSNNDIPAYNSFRKAKQEITKTLREELKLEELKPRVLTSFVRNKLIDQVYFPLFGDNLAKQLGTVGDKTRTDRSGMLLLISPPGYGKTTLMEYIADRLGLVFIRINGPAIGHEITSVDPISATNSAAREELKKLNLAFEMGNNVMLYLDDIQHCNPEFLQKFISLSDGTRKIEGVYNGKSKTYDLRGKKFCVIMAGNPYTET